MWNILTMTATLSALPALAVMTSFQAPTGGYSCTVLDARYSSAAEWTSNPEGMDVLERQVGNRFSAKLYADSIRLNERTYILPGRTTPADAEQVFAIPETGEIFTYVLVPVKEPAGRERAWPWRLSYSWTQRADDNDAYGMAPGDHVIFRGECQLLSPAR